MKRTKHSSALMYLLVAVTPWLIFEKLHAGNADPTFNSFAAAQTKKQCIAACRQRYRDCRRLNQLPSFECRDVYQDCTRYSCTGLGPG